MKGMIEMSGAQIGVGDAMQDDGTPLKIVSVVAGELTVTIPMEAAAAKAIGQHLLGLNIEIATRLPNGQANGAP